MKQTKTMTDLHNAIDEMAVHTKVRELHDHTYTVLVDGVADNDYIMDADSFYALACFAVDPELHTEPDEYVSAITQNMIRILTGMLMELPEHEILQSLGVRMDRLAELQANAKGAVKKPTSPLRVVWDADEYEYALAKKEAV